MPEDPGHQVDLEKWPFDEDPHLGVFTTRPVMEEEHAILLVTHDTDGDWQFLCGTTDDLDDARLVCLHHILDWDESVGELVDLPRGWSAYRGDAQEDWSREPTPHGLREQIGELRDRVRLLVRRLKRASRRG